MDPKPFGERAVYTETRGERRARQQRRRRYGMQVSGTSVKVLATIIPKTKRRKRKQNRR